MDFNFAQIYLIDDVDIEQMYDTYSEENIPTSDYDEDNDDVAEGGFNFANLLSNIGNLSDMLENKNKNKNRYKYYLITSNDLIHTQKENQNEFISNLKIKPIYDKFIFEYYDNLIPAEENIKIPKFENVRMISYKDNNMRFKKSDDINIKFIESLLQFNDSELYIPCIDMWIKNINEFENKEGLKHEFILKCKYNFEELHDYFKNYYDKIYAYTDYKQYCIKNDWI